MSEEADMLERRGTSVPRETSQSEQQVLNFSFDEVHKLLMTGQLAYNPTGIDPVTGLPGRYDRVQIDDTTGGLMVKLADGNITIGSEVEIKNDSGNPVPTKTTPNQFVSTANVTSTPLGIGGVFTGSWEDVTNYDFLQIAVFTSHNSAVDGAVLLFSTDGGTTTTRQITQTITGGIGALSFDIPITAYNAFKVIYTNGGTAQTYFQTRIVAQTSSNPIPIVPVGSIIRGNDGAVLVNTAHNTYTSTSVTVTGSGNNNVITPDTGKRIRLYYVALSAKSNNSSAVDVEIKFASGGTPFYKVSLVAGAMFARNVGAGRHYVEGAVGEALMVNLSTTVNGLFVSVEYEQY